MNLDIRRSIAKVDANGRLNGQSGSGTRQLGMLGCSGRWTAQKRSGIVQGWRLLRNTLSDLTLTRLARP